MVLWSNAWLERLDENQVKIRLWERKRENNYFTCILCNSDLKYSSQGFQAFQQQIIIIVRLAFQK